MALPALNVCVPLPLGVPVSMYDPGAVSWPRGSAGGGGTGAVSWPWGSWGPLVLGMGTGGQLGPLGYFGFLVSDAAPMLLGRFVFGCKSVYESGLCQQGVLLS